MDVFICWYIWAICEFARGLQSSQGRLFSMCQSFTKVHCSGNCWFTFMSEFTFMSVGEGELLWDMMHKGTNFFFPSKCLLPHESAYLEYITLDSSTLSRQHTERRLEHSSVFFQKPLFLQRLWLAQEIFTGWKRQTVNDKFRCGDKIIFTFLLGSVLSRLSQGSFFQILWS